MAQQTGRKLFVTPANYLNFVRRYTQIFLAQKKKIEDKINKLSGGVKMLISAKEDVEKMSVQLE